MLQSAEDNHKRPTNGRMGCITPTQWPPQRFKAGDKIRIAPTWGDRLCNSCHFGASPMLQSGVETQEWPTTMRICYMARAWLVVRGVPNACWPFLIFSPSLKCREPPQTAWVM